MARKTAPKAQVPEPVAAAATGPEGVFISHVHEDELLAKAFKLLIENVSAGVVPTYSSTAKQFGQGIQYGEEWFRWICENVEKARHIVALLTPTSVGRPWILFEAGLGRAKRDSVVFGVVLGISREEAYKGPFAVLQNCGTEEEELVKLCRELIAGSPANPNEQMISQCVSVFRSTVDKHFASQKPGKKQSEEPVATAVFQALEEMKLILREQARMSEVDMPWEPLRAEDAERLFRLMRHFDPELDPELHLALLRGLAARLGQAWVNPLIDYLVGAPKPLARRRFERMVGPLHEIFMVTQRRHRRIDRDAFDLLFMEMERALSRYVDARSPREPGESMEGPGPRPRTPAKRHANAGDK